MNFPQQHRWPHQAPFSDPVSTKEGGIFVKDENLDSPFFKKTQKAKNLVNKRCFPRYSAKYLNITFFSLIDSRNTLFETIN